MTLQIYYRRLKAKNVIKPITVQSVGSSLLKTTCFTNSSSSGSLRFTYKVIFHLPVCRSRNHHQTVGKEVLVQKAPVKLLSMEKPTGGGCFQKHVPTGHSAEVQHLFFTVSTQEAFQTEHRAHLARSVKELLD